MANFLKHFRGPRNNSGSTNTGSTTNTSKAGRGNHPHLHRNKKGPPHADSVPPESSASSSSVAPLDARTSSTCAPGVVTVSHYSSARVGDRNSRHAPQASSFTVTSSSSSHRSLRSWGRRRKRGEDDREDTAKSSSGWSAGTSTTNTTPAGPATTTATTTLSVPPSQSTPSTCTPPLTPETHDTTEAPNATESPSMVPPHASSSSPSAAAAAAATSAEPSSWGIYSPFVPEESVPAVQRALAGERVGKHDQLTANLEQSGTDKGKDDINNSNDSNDEDDWNAIAHAVKALDRAGHELFARGEYEAAFERYERALVLKRSTLQSDVDDNTSGAKGRALPPPLGVAAKDPPTDPSAGPAAPPRADIVASVATSINNMTYLQQRAGVLSADESLASYFKSLQMKREIHGPKHLSVGKTLNNIGSVFYLKREYLPALQAYQDAQRIMEDSLGSEHGDVGTVLSNIGDVYFALERHPEALDHYRTALRIRWVALGPSDPKVARLMHRIAALETGKQPVKGDDEESDSESEEYQEEDRRRSALFREDVLSLQDEIMEDMKFFDLLEREMAINMLKDKMRIFREIRELYNEVEDGNPMSSVAAVVPGAVVSQVSESDHGIKAMPTPKPPHSEAKLVRTRSHSDGAIDPNASVDSSDLPSPAWKSAKGQGVALSSEDRQNALTSVQSRLAKLRADRACVSESSGDDLRAMAGAVDPSSFSSSHDAAARKSYMFPTASSAAKTSGPMRRFLPVLSPDKRQLREEIRQRRLQASTPKNLLPNFDHAADVAGSSLVTEPPLAVSSQPA